MYNPDIHMTRGQVKHLLKISEDTFWRLMRDGQIAPVAEHERFHLFDRRDILKLKKERKGRLTVATWKPGIKAFYNGKMVVNVKQTSDAQYYWLETVDDELYKVYKNVQLYTSI